MDVSSSQKVIFLVHAGDAVVDNMVTTACSCCAVDYVVTSGTCKSTNHVFGVRHYSHVTTIHNVLNTANKSMSFQANVTLFDIFPVVSFSCSIVA